MMTCLVNKPSAHSCSLAAEIQASDEQLLWFEGLHWTISYKRVLRLNITYLIVNFDIRPRALAIAFAAQGLPYCTAVYQACLCTIETLTRSGNLFAVSLIQFDGLVGRWGAFNSKRGEDAIGAKTQHHRPEPLPGQQISTHVRDTTWQALRPEIDVTETQLLYNR
jgi:hypothetical protein